MAQEVRTAFVAFVFLRALAMPSKPIDRSARILKVGDRVQVIREEADLTAFCHHAEINCPNPDICGLEGQVLDLDKHDSTAEVRIEDSHEVWWIPIGALGPPSGADSAVCAESVSLELSERLFHDDAFKDVTFKLHDGEERAHRSVMAAASSVFAAMHSGPMREATTGTVELPDVTRSTMRAFLRLLYTGHVDQADWSSPGASAAGPQVPPEKMPLEMLLDIVRLAKKYIVESVTILAVEALKLRLREADGDARVLETILVAAIAADLSGLRMAAIASAKASKEVRALYDGHGLRPEVQAELQSIWPPRRRVVGKRARLE